MIIEIFAFIASVFSGVFDSLANTEVEPGISVLSLFVAILFVRLVLWFVFRLLDYDFDFSAPEIFKEKRLYRNDKKNIGKLKVKK